MRQIGSNELEKQRVAYFKVDFGSVYSQISKDFLRAAVISFVLALYNGEIGSQLSWSIWWSS